MLNSETANSGSNLTMANHIIIADVLNHNKEQFIQTDKQCIGRAVRLGQNKPCIVTRFITNNTVESEHFNTVKYNIEDIQ